MPSGKPLPEWACSISAFVKGAGFGGQEKDQEEQFSHEEGGFGKTLKTCQAGKARKGDQGGRTNPEDAPCQTSGKGKGAGTEAPEANAGD